MASLTKEYLESIHEIIGERLNFSSEISSEIEFESDFILNNEMIRMTKKFYNKRRSFKVGVAHYICVFDHVFLVPKPVPYTYLEKALLPFDSEVWFWLIGYLTVGVIVIVVVSFASKKVQRFVFGLRVKTPMLNLV
jgi:hypothetical protein